MTLKKLHNRKIKFAINTGKQTQLNFDDSSKLVVKQLLESKMFLGSHTTNDPTIFYAPFNNIDLLWTPNCQARVMLTNLSSIQVVKVNEFVVSNSKAHNMLDGSSMLEVRGCSPKDNN